MAEQSSNDRASDSDRLIFPSLGLLQYHCHVSVGLAHATVVGQDDVAAAEPKHLTAAKVAVEPKEHCHGSCTALRASKDAGDDAGELPWEWRV